MPKSSLSDLSFIYVLYKGLKFHYLGDSHLKNNFAPQCAGKQACPRISNVFYVTLAGQISSRTKKNVFMIAVSEVAKTPLVYCRINDFQFMFHVFNRSPENLKRQLKMSSTSHAFLSKLKKIIIYKQQNLYSPSGTHKRPCK